jgi:hypothetical protein
MEASQRLPDDSDILQSLQLFLMYSLPAVTFLRGLVIQAQSL